MPELLTSWTRLIAGNWRDPLVGRDVLIGVLAAAGYLAVISAGTMRPQPTRSMHRK
jgi:hypothetical protein